MVPGNDKVWNVAPEWMAGGEGRGKGRMSSR